MNYKRKRVRVGKKGDDGRIVEHRLIVEKCAKIILPKTAIVHHIDNDIFNNTNNNLVICENQAYHMLLHQRQNALEESGDANFRKCVFCKKYDAVSNLYISPKNQVRHRVCWNSYQKERRSNVN